MNKKTEDYQIKTGKQIFAVLFFLFFMVTSAQAENIFIKFYQDHISAADGDRCPMQPSCSSYAAAAIEKHGPAIGWIMAFDRLVRCGRDEKSLSMKIAVDKQEYTYDPVDANDFWWFKKETKK